MLCPNTYNLALWLKGQNAVQTYGKITLLKLIHLSLFCLLLEVREFSISAMNTMQIWCTKYIAWKHLGTYEL